MESDELALMERQAENLQRERDRASAMRMRGVKLLLLLPLNFFLVLALLALFGSSAIVSIMFVVASIYGAIGGIAGLVMVAVGTAQKRVAGERLSDLMARRALPEARVVVR